MNILKVLAAEATVNTTSNTTVGNNVLVRLVNTDTAAHLITQVTPSGNLTVTVLANSEVVVQKGTTDTLFSNAATAVVLAVPVAFKN